MFKPLYIKNFPKKLRKKLEHMAVDDNMTIGKFIIKLLKEKSSTGENKK